MCLTGASDTHAAGMLLREFWPAAVSTRLLLVVAGLSQCTLQLCVRHGQCWIFSRLCLSLQIGHMSNGR